MSAASVIERIFPFVQQCLVEMAAGNLAEDASITLSTEKGELTLHLKFANVATKGTGIGVDDYDEEAFDQYEDAEWERMRLEAQREAEWEADYTQFLKEEAEAFEQDCREQAEAEAAFYQFQQDEEHAIKRAARAQQAAEDDFLPF